jgi:hypothetical protein
MHNANETSVMPTSEMLSIPSKKVSTNLSTFFLPTTANFYHPSSPSFPPPVTYSPTRTSEDFYFTLRRNLSIRFVGTPE